MSSKMIKDSLDVAYTYLSHIYGKKDLDILCSDLCSLAGIKKHIFKESKLLKVCSYENTQMILSNINEKESIRKSKGVYYTPTDVVKFILYNTIRGAEGKLKHTNLHVLDLNGVSYREIAYNKTVFDPTCGAGEFLLSTIDVKFDLLDLNIKNVTVEQVEKVIETIFGNDINVESTVISKIRLYLCVLYRYDKYHARASVKLLNKSFTNYDFISNTKRTKKKYDIVIGNPPYVEDSKSGLDLKKKYGNIYANVLINVASVLNKGGAMGFIIPLSYVATPRMSSIREDLMKKIPEQYILSYSDRPDCLFASVHQKLCILIGLKKECDETIYTSNYQYWYRDNRDDLFISTKAVRNRYVETQFIPKLGRGIDGRIYKKVISKKNRTTILDLETNSGTGKLFLNMRAAFWIKCFIEEHKGSEYKSYIFKDTDVACYVNCVLNSSLFWWYWVCVSDCWHITRKELWGFMLPLIDDYSKVNELSNQLEKKLEDTKLYVGTKQTEYEYKHKDCVDVIHRIDDYVNELFGLTDEESVYIKNFAYQYRTGGGAEIGKKKS